jgi:arsenate reductase (thioredoxin)
MADLVVFVCVHNAGRSQIAAALFNRLADPAKAKATSGGTRPLSRVHLEAAVVMREIGIDISGARPQKLKTQPAALLVTMGCGDERPTLPVAERMDWPLEDPKGKPIEKVRAIRDDIRARVEALIAERGWK